VRPAGSVTYSIQPANLCQFERWELALGRAVRHLVPNLGHSIVEEKPDTVNQLLVGFLNKGAVS
jgi:pimeloyl-ACP methyl ester carboxylesterase